jgi:hypothetical protein
MKVKNGKKQAYINTYGGFFTYPSNTFMPILPCNGKNFLRGIVPDERRKPESK